VDEVGRFYKVQDQPAGTHLALRWKDRVRIIVPREVAARNACWNVFRPGWLEFPLRAIARLPRLLGAVSCVEAERLASIRDAIGKEAGLSCCRAGAPGPWSKDTILLLDKRSAAPLYVVKAGVGEAVDLLLGNEVKWLRTLRDQPELVDHIPDLVAYCSGTYLSFVAVTPLPGKFDYRFGDLHVAFLRKLQDYSCQIIRFEESRLYHNLRARMKNLRGLITEAWSTRLDKAMQQIEQPLTGAPILLVAAHNDFTPWNIRLERGVARVFDWEYAEFEQLPLFDPLHFALLPMSLRRRSATSMIQCMHQTLQQCQQWLGKEHCHEAQSQALAYLINLCTLYLWAERGKSDSNPVLEGYAGIIDYMCHL
jgi:hypothetical protein